MMEDDVEVDIATGSPSRVVVEGKTSVPFKSFVSLILQRRVQTLFKSNQNDPVIVSSTLLTALASAPGDKQEDKGKLVLVTFGAGILGGVLLGAVTMIVLTSLEIAPGLRDYGIVAGVILLVGVLGMILQKNQKKSGLTEKLMDAMEKTTDLLSR